MSLSPNPFNDACEISVSCNPDFIGASCATVEICDLRGKRICMHVVGARHSNEQTQSNEALSRNASPIRDGARTFIWTPDKSIPSGVYLVKARTEDGREMGKRVVYSK